MAKGSSFCLTIFIFVGSLFGQNYNNISATTSASGKLDVTGGKAYETMAVLSWTFTHDNGTLVAKWGTTQGYGNTKNLYPYTANSTANDTLTGLTGGTLYYYQFQGSYQGDANSLSGSFTTYQTTGIQPVNAGLANSERVTLTSRPNQIQIRYNLPQSPYLRVSMYDIYGKKVFFLEKPVTSGSQSLNLDTKGYASGAYVVRMEYGNVSLVARAFLYN